MTIEPDLLKDLPLDEDVAENVTGGRKKSGKAGISKVVAGPVVASPVAPTAGESNTPLPISPFGDDCIPAEDATGAGSSS